MQTFTKTIYVASARTKFSKIPETIYMAKHIYGGAPLYESQCKDVAVNRVSERINDLDF